MANHVTDGYNPDFDPTGIEGGVDTNALPWLDIPQAPGLRFKPLRASGETGMISAVVGLAAGTALAPMVHLGPADFLLLSGRIGYRAGPPEGYGRGVWFYEPAGARHDSTRRLGDEDLVYTANVYGPIQFDDGPGTPISAVQSWMQYKAAAEASGRPLVANVFDGDSSLLAWSPLGSNAAAPTG